MLPPHSLNAGGTWLARGTNCFQCKRGTGFLDAYQQRNEYAQPERASDPREGRLIPYQKHGEKVVGHEEEVIKEQGVK